MSKSFYKGERNMKRVLLMFIVCFSFLSFNSLYVNAQYANYNDLYQSYSYTDAKDYVRTSVAFKYTGAQAQSQAAYVNYVTSRTCYYSACRATATSYQNQLAADAYGHWHSRREINPK